MTSTRRLFAAFAAVLLMTSSALALELGDAAPALKIDSWIKGDAVDLNAGKGKNVYVVEFWATWCGPCRMSIPHLTELQKQFKDQNVVFIGISDEPVSKVKPFVDGQGDKMDYVVAVDKDKATGQAYMAPFGVNGIPHAFVVDKAGKLVWHGHPMAELDSVLKKVLAGTYDIASAKRSAEAEKKMNEYFELVSSKGNTPEATALGRSVLELGKDNSQLMNQFAWVILTHPRIKDRDRDLALSAAEAANAAAEGKDPSVLDTYARALFDTGKKEEAVKAQQKAIELTTDERMRGDLEKTLEEYKSAVGKP